jgi:acyl carrier protein
MASISEIVIQTIATLVKRKADELGPETRLAEDLVLKSVNRIELAAVLEDRLKVPISNFDILKPRTIGAVIAMIEAKKG